MRYCPSCRIDFTGVLDRCPLCGSKLEGTPEGMIFPENEFARTKKLAKRSMIALTFAALAFVAFLCVRTHASAVTGIASFAAVIMNYIFIRNVVVHSPSFLRIIERYFLVVMALALLLLLATGDSRLATYVVPALTLVALFFNGVLVAVFRNGFVQGYAKYLLFNFVLGMVPLVLLATGLVSQPALSIASGVVSGLLLVLLLVLTRKQLFSEMQKLFHR